MNYYTAETDGARPIRENWHRTNAARVEDAKRVASRRKMFQGTTLWVGAHFNGFMLAVAVKRDDPINMNIRGSWVDLHPYELLDYND